MTVEVPAPAAGVLSDIKVPQGTTVADRLRAGLDQRGRRGARIETAGRGAACLEADAAAGQRQAGTTSCCGPGGMPPAPSARKMMEEKGLSASDVHGSGRRGQVLKEDVIAAAASPSRRHRLAHPPRPRPTRPRRRLRPCRRRRCARPSVANDAAREERVRMTRLRQTIARRLKDAQNTAAMLTTFNDVDMSAIMKLRSEYKDLFEKRHHVKLGFMGFFVKACIQALREVPAVNAEIDGQDIIYKNYYHIGVAVSTDRGLVVPVVREADRMSLAEIEQTIADFGRRAREGKLSIEEMQGGTFTITNGGVFGSLLSTPILNAPQSGILGMHRIEERAVVQDGQIVARPMMSLALSYDHRIVDGKDAVTFLVRVKECLEDPQRFLLEV